MKLGVAHAIFEYKRIAVPETIDNPFGRRKNVGANLEIRVSPKGLELRIPMLNDVFGPRIATSSLPQSRRFLSVHSRCIPEIKSNMDARVSGRRSHAQDVNLQF